MVDFAEGDVVAVDVDGIAYVGTVHQVHRTYPFENDDWLEVVVEGTEPLMIFAACKQVEAV